jgi:hypothetical protein
MSEIDISTTTFTAKIERARDVLDTLAGAVLRLFAALARHWRRSSVTSPRASQKGRYHPPSTVAARRPRGRPKGSPNRAKPVFMDIEQVSGA